MPTQQSVGLDNVQGLLPESGAARQQHLAKTVSVGQLRSFHLAVEDNELLAEHGVFGYLSYLDSTNTANENIMTAPSTDNSHEKAVQSC